MTGPVVPIIPDLRHVTLAARRIPWGSHDFLVIDHPHVPDGLQFRFAADQKFFTAMDRVFGVREHLENTFGYRNMYDRFR